MRILLASSVAVVLLTAACSSGTSSAPASAAGPAATPVPFTTGEAQTLLLRSLQAQKRGDVEAVKADLFPRELNVAAACAKTKLAFTRSAMTGAMADDEGRNPEITSVNVTLTRTDEKHFQGRYTVPGNAALEGTESFVYEQGRWWIQCSM